MNAILGIQDLTICRGSRRVLEGIELSLEPAEMVALIGPNGSGKTTLLKTIAGLIRPSQGQIRIGGYSTHSQLALARQLTGFMVAQEQLPRLLTGQQCLQLFAQARGLEGMPDESWRQVQELGLAPWLGEWVGSYSLGTRQKLSVVLALLDSPPLILLDEPLNGLDPVSSLALKHVLSRLTEDRGCTIVMAVHDLAIVEQLHQRIIVLLDGRIQLDWSRKRMQEALSHRNQTLEETIVDALTRNRVPD